MSEVQIIVSGPVGSGKSALLGEIEIMCRALGIPVRYADEAAAQAEKGLTHADWTAELEMYKPSVVLIEGQPWRDKGAHETMAKQPAITEADVRAAQANAIQGFVDACKDAGVISDAVVSVAAQCIAAIRSGAPKDKAVTHEAEALGDKDAAEQRGSEAL